MGEGFGELGFVVALEAKPGEAALGVAARADSGESAHLVAAGDEAVVHELTRELV